MSDGEKSAPPVPRPSFNSTTSFSASRARRPAGFLDDGGTLTAIVERPEQPILKANTCQAIGHLARQCLVAIVNDRERRGVQKLVGIDLIYGPSLRGIQQVCGE